MGTETQPVALDRSEREELKRCEAVIERGLDTFVEVGGALLDIRDNRLYRENYSTFEDYCRERWGWERRHAYRLMDAAKVAENVSNWTQTLPTAESQVRPLTKLEPEAQRDVWEQAIEESNGHAPTAAKVEEVVDSYLGAAVERRKRERARGRHLRRKPAKRITREQLREERKRQRRLAEEMKQNAEWNHKVSIFIEAIETLANPQLPLKELAAEILDRNTPDKDWPGQTITALENLHKFAKELNYARTR